MYLWGRIQATVRFFGRRKMHSAGGDFKILLCTYVPYGLELQTSKAVRIPAPAGITLCKKRRKYYASIN